MQTIAASPANQLLVIQILARGTESNLLRMTNHQLALNAILIGTNDSFVSAPNTEIMGSSVNFRCDKLHKSANRKNPSPASTSPASLIFGTEKFKKYSSDATRLVGQSFSSPFPRIMISNAVAATNRA